jgi:MFS family permease
MMDESPAAPAGSVEAVRAATVQDAGLFRNPNFRMLWLGQTISMFGSQVTALALPLTAVLMLNASADQMGLLRSAGFLPTLLLGLFVGVLVDHVPDRPLMIASNLGLAAVLASVPVAAWLGVLRIEQLYVVAVLVGLLGLFFSVAYMSFLPAVAHRDHLLEANSKLQLSGSAAFVAGPSLAGVLVQVFTAPFAILVDVFGFLVSAGSLMLIKADEQPPAETRQRGVANQIKEGLSFTLTQPILRSLTATNATFNIFFSALLAVYILYLSDELHLDPLVIGLVLGFLGVGGILGGIVTGRVTRRFGLGPTMLGSMVLSGIGALFGPLAAGPAAMEAVILMVGALLYSIGSVLYGVNAVSLQQSITPDPLLGRVNATMQVVSAGVMAIGGVMGGFMALAIGLRPTMAVVAVGMLLAAAWIYFSPIRTLR